MANKEIPKDPMILLSYVNTMLRDHFSSLDKLCEDLDIPAEEIISKLSSIGYDYDATLNKFI